MRAGALVVAMALTASALRAATPPPAERVAVASGPGYGRGRHVLARGDGALVVPSHRAVGWEQRARRLPDGRYDVTIVTRADVPRPRAPFPRVAPADDPMAAWLGGGEAASSPVRELAAELVAGHGDQVDASAAIVTWVSLNIAHSDAPGHEDSAASTLESRVGSCVGRSRLAVALLRAAGLPARTVHGLVVVARAANGQPAPFLLHRFIETHVDGAGWIPSDPGDSVHLVAPSHVILAFDDEPYDPEWQRELVVAPVETEEPLAIDAIPPPGSRPLILRAWGAERRASRMTR